MTSKTIVLRFPKDVGGQPIVYALAKEYDLVFNILKAEVSPDREGVLVLEINGDQKNYDEGIKYLKKQKIGVEPLNKEIIRDTDLCTQCGACVPHCPTGALYYKDLKTREIEFDKSKCILCEACIQPCPPRAMKIDF